MSAPFFEGPGCIVSGCLATMHLTYVDEHRDRVWLDGADGWTLDTNDTGWRCPVHSPHPDTREPEA